MEDLCFLTFNAHFFKALFPTFPSYSLVDEIVVAGGVSLMTDQSADDYSHRAGLQNHHSARVKLTQMLFDANENLMQINDI